MLTSPICLKKTHHKNWPAMPLCLLCLFAILTTSCSDTSSGPSNTNMAGGVTDIGNSIALLKHDGTPAALARVVAYYDQWDRKNPEDSVVTTADENGKFTLFVNAQKNVVLMASLDGESALGHLPATGDSTKLHLQVFKHLSGRMAQKSSGYMRLVGPGTTAKIKPDGTFTFDSIPAGEITLAYVSDTPEARVDFAMLTAADSIELPTFEKRDTPKNWLVLSDYRYYADGGFGGIVVTSPEESKPFKGKVMEIPVTGTSDTHREPLTETLKDFVVPASLSISQFNTNNITISDLEGNPLDFETEESFERIIAWVKVDSIPKGDSSTFIVASPQAATEHNTPFAPSTYMANFHIDGTEKIAGNDSTTKDTLSHGILGAGIDLHPGKSINLDNIDPCAGDFTISLWTKWKGGNGNHQILAAQRDYWSDTTSRFQWHYEGSWGHFIALNGSFDKEEGKFVDFGDSTIVPINTWAYLALVYESGKMTMYVNGEQVGETKEFIPNEVQGNVAFRIGGDEIPTETWNGTLDEIRVESTARSAAWIRAVYESISETSNIYYIIRLTY